MLQASAKRSTPAFSSTRKYRPQSQTSVSHTARIAAFSPSDALSASARLRLTACSSACNCSARLRSVMFLLIPRYPMNLPESSNTGAPLMLTQNVSPVALADLAADDADRIQQSLVGVAYLAAVEREHADHFSLRHDRKKKSAVHAGIARKLHLGHARVCGNVGRPYRLLGLPRPAGQARARRVSEFARTGDKALDRFHLHAP